MVTKKKQSPKNIWQQVAIGPSPNLYFEPGSSSTQEPLPEGAVRHDRGLPTPTKLKAPCVEILDGEESQFIPWEGLGEVPPELPDRLAQGVGGSVLIVGSSGSGKTSLLKELKRKWNCDGPLIPKGEFTEGRSIVDSFSTPEQATKWLNQVGMKSIPTWGKPFSCLSSGDMYRASVALKLSQRRANTPVLFDEWTSVLDRGLATTLSIQMNKVMKKAAERGDHGPWVFAGCHDDVASYLGTEYFIRCVRGEHSDCLKNTYRDLPTITSRFVSEQDPRGLGNHKYIGVFTFDDPKVSILTAKSFSVLHVGRGYQAGVSLGKKVSGKGCQPVLKAVNDSLESDDGKFKLSEDEEGFFVMADGKRYKAFRDEEPVLSLGVFRKQQCSQDLLQYKILEIDLMEKSRWYLPDGYKNNSYRGLPCTGIQETRPIFRPSDEKEEKKRGLPYCCVSVPLSHNVKEATKVLDHPFKGTSVFDIPVLPSLSDYRIGVIVGSCCSGKTVLARHFFGESIFELEWSDELSVLRHLGSDADLAEELLRAVQLDDSIYLRKFSTLSCGEQARAVYARLLMVGIQNKSPIVLEEFTAVVDRSTALKVALGVQAIAVKYGMSVIMSSCHGDFIGKDMVEPDWLLELPSRRFFHFAVDRHAQPAGVVSDRDVNTHQGLSVDSWTQSLSRRPSLEIEVRRCSNSEWQLFREHHYKDHCLNPSCVCYVALMNGKPVGFSAWCREPINWAFKNIYAERKNSGKRGSGLWDSALELPDAWAERVMYWEHRTVILPEYQSIGLGRLLCDTISYVNDQMGMMSTTKSKHSRYGGYRDNNPLWRPTPNNNKSEKSSSGHDVLIKQHIWCGPQDDVEKAKLQSLVTIDPPITPGCAIRAPKSFKIFDKDDNSYSHFPGLAKSFTRAPAFDIKYEVMPGADPVLRKLRGEVAPPGKPGRPPTLKPSSPSVVRPSKRFPSTSPSSIRQLSLAESFSRGSSHKKRRPDLRTSNDIQPDAWGGFGGIISSDEEEREEPAQPTPWSRDGSGLTQTLHGLTTATPFRLPNSISPSGSEASHNMVIECPQCTYFNASDREFCEMCEGCIMDEQAIPNPELSGSSRSSSCSGIKPKNIFGERELAPTFPYGQSSGSREINLSNNAASSSSARGSSSVRASTDIFKSTDAASSSGVRVPAQPSVETLDLNDTSDEDVQISASASSSAPPVAASSSSSHAVGVLNGTNGSGSGMPAYLQVDMLMEMGYSRPQAEKSLEHTKGNLQQAVELLTDGTIQLLMSMEEEG